MIISLLNPLPNIKGLGDSLEYSGLSPKRPVKKKKKKERFSLRYQYLLHVFSLCCSLNFLFGFPPCALYELKGGSNLNVLTSKKLIIDMTQPPRLLIINRHSALSEYKLYLQTRKQGIVSLRAIRELSKMCRPILSFYRWRN